MSTLKVDSILNTAGVDNRGKIIQTVNDTTAVTRFVSTASSFTDTGYSVTITPKYANSQIRIDWHIPTYNTTHYSYLDLYRNGSVALGINQSDYGLHGPIHYYTSYWQIASGSLFDSPNTTSSVTYNVYAKQGASGTIYVGASTSPVSYPNGVYLSATEIAQ